MLEGKYTKGNGVNMRIMRPEALLSRMAKRIERDSFSRENPLAFFIFLLGPKEMWRAKVCLLVATVTLGGTISIGTAVETPSKGPTFGMPVPVILSLRATVILDPWLVNVYVQVMCVIRIRIRP